MHDWVTICGLNRCAEYNNKIGQIIGIHDMTMYGRAGVILFPSKKGLMVPFTNLLLINYHSTGSITEVISGQENVLPESINLSKPEIYQASSGSHLPLAQSKIERKNEK